jgi:predicted transcriptional regulator
MMKKKVLIGGSLEDAARRVAEAWHKADRGEKVQVRDTVTFLSWSSLSSVMTDKRYELLRYLHAHPTTSIRALSRALHRDYKRVHEDVTALSAVGLIDRDGQLLRADYDEIQTSITLVPPAA